MKVTAVVPASRPVSDLPTVTAPRALHHVDELARALGQALGIEVPIVEGTLADAPPDGYILLFGLRYDSDTRLGPRIIAFEQDRSTIMKNVEAFSLVAAVEKQRYFQWHAARSKERGYGLVGLKDVADRMGAHAEDGPYTSARYSMLSSDNATDLVGLLAEYLRAYAQVMSIH